MKLDQFFQDIAPFLEGKGTHAQAKSALWGDRAPEPDAGRLAIYGDFCRVHRFEAVDSVFAETRKALIAARGEGAWRSLVEDLFVKHPMHHVELNENGLALPEFMAAEQQARKLPLHLVELADLEAAEWRTLIAPDAPEDEGPREGKLRLASTVDVRPYRHDLIEWLDGPEAGGPRPKEPKRTLTRVIFWRDTDLDLRRGNADDFELILLKRVMDGTPLASGLNPQSAQAVLEDLCEAGILLGKP
ncbi:MAG: putative DNA-binding domain-containing protein [Deltaproteobacteria bacterium]|nr:putative DNA-binding domain-containing protein [Deltaproteobacteria bacterium]